MPIATFGKKVFEVSANKIYTLSDMQYSSSLDTEKQDAAGKKPSTYNKGPGLNSLSFKLSLKASLGINPRRELEEWETIKDAGVAYQFILGGRPLGKNKWLLVDVQASEEIIDNTGAILELVLNLKFDEYVRPGSASASTSKSSKKVSVPGIQLPDYSDNENILGSAVTVSANASMKRYNPNIIDRI